MLASENNNENLEIKVADFGLSQFTSDKERTKRMCGSPGYVAPEILRGKGCDPKSDIFSLGAIFYNLMTGRALFPGKSVDEVLERNANADISCAKKHIDLLPSNARSLLIILL